jgi:hypothetical protein
LIEGLPIKAVGRFPIVRAKTEQWPEITEVTWYTMALSIASRNQEDFHKVYALCNKKLGTNAEAPAQYASTYIRGPAVGGPLRYQGPPPPPPPRPPPPAATFRQSFHVTTNTRTIEFVPDTVLSTTMYDDNIDKDTDEDILEC